MTTVPIYINGLHYNYEPNLYTQHTPIHNIHTQYVSTMNYQYDLTGVVQHQVETTSIASPNPVSGYVSDFTKPRPQQAHQNDADVSNPKNPLAIILRKSEENVNLREKETPVKEIRYCNKKNLTEVTSTLDMKERLHKRFDSVTPQRNPASFNDIYQSMLNRFNTTTRDDVDGKRLEIKTHNTITSLGEIDSNGKGVGQTDESCNMEQLLNNLFKKAEVKTVEIYGDSNYLSVKGRNQVADHEQSSLNDIHEKETAASEYHDNKGSLELIKEETNKKAINEQLQSVTPISLFTMPTEKIITDVNSAPRSLGALDNKGLCFMNEVPRHGVSSNSIREVVGPSIPECNQMAAELPPFIMGQLSRCNRKIHHNDSEFGFVSSRILNTMRIENTCNEELGMIHLKYQEIMNKKAFRKYSYPVMQNDY